MHTVTVGFRGFESSLHGIAAYDWAIGTEPMGEDVQPYMEYAIRHTETFEENLHGKLCPMFRYVYYFHNVIKTA